MNNTIFYCTLDSELHECSHYKPATKQCTKGAYCCFRDEIKPNQEQKRKPKWFEKYYK